MAFDYAQALQEALSPINNLSAGTIALARQQGQEQTDLAKTRFLQESRALEAQKELEQHGRIQKEYLQAADKIAEERERRAELRREQADLEKQEAVYGITPAKDATLQERRTAVTTKAGNKSTEPILHYQSEINRYGDKADAIIKHLKDQMGSEVPDKVLRQAAEIATHDPSLAGILTAKQTALLRSPNVTRETINKIADDLHKTFLGNLGITGGDPAKSAMFLSAIDKAKADIMGVEKKEDYQIAVTQLQQLGQQKLHAEELKDRFIAQNAANLPEGFLSKLDQRGAGLSPVDQPPVPGTNGVAPAGSPSVMVPPNVRAGLVTPSAPAVSASRTALGYSLRNPSDIPDPFAPSTGWNSEWEQAMALPVNPSQATTPTAPAQQPSPVAALAAGMPSSSNVLTMGNAYMAGKAPQMQADPAHQNIATKMQSGQQLSDADIEAGTMATARDPQKLALAQKVFKTADVNQLSNFGKILNRAKGSAGATQLIKAAMDGDMLAQAQIDTITRGGGMQQTDYSNTAGAVGRAFNLQTPTFHAPDYGTQPANSF